MSDPARKSTPPAGSAPKMGQHAKQRHGWVFSIALLLIGLGVAGVWWLVRPAENVRYLTAEVTRGSVTRSITASGTVNPDIVVQVGSYVSGVVQERFCDYNTRVTKGQLCARIDPRPYQISVDQARANLAVAHAQLAKDVANQTYANAAYQRAQSLFPRQAVSQDALEAARNVSEQAQAQADLDRATIAQREAELHAAEVNLDYTDIRSPVDGTVVSRNVEMGQTVAASFQTPTLFLIATDLTRMQVDTNESEGDVGQVRAGTSGSFTVESFPNRIFNGTVSDVRQAPQSVQNVVTYDAVLTAANDDLALKPGMTATVHIVADQLDDVVRIPDAAFRYAPGGAGTEAVPLAGQRVYVLQNDVPVAVTLEAGLDDATNTQMVKGPLKPGDKVVIGEVVSTSSGSVHAGALRAPRL